MTERTLKEQVVETVEILSTHDRATERMNKYLEAGWILLEHWVADFGDPAHRTETAHFLLGWTDHSKPAPHPKKKNDYAGLVR